MKTSKDKFSFFSFAYNEWLEVLTMDDVEAGKRFKQMIIRLGKNEAPEDSIEYQMIERANSFREKQKEKIMKRWHPEQVSEIPKAHVCEPVSVPEQAPQKMKLHKIPAPNISDVYEYCKKNKFPEPYGNEWMKWMDGKGWMISTTWQTALNGFCRKKMKT